ncbi:FHA domain protein, partial [Chlamydia psittaci 08-2626_L3]
QNNLLQNSKILPILLLPIKIKNSLKLS